MNRKLNNTVAVVDRELTPLAPCNPAKARKLIKNGKARVVSKKPYTIMLKHVAFEGDGQDGIRNRPVAVR